MSYRLLAEAAGDLDAAVGYYEKIHPGLALEYLDNFEWTIQHVVGFTEAWTQVTPTLRRCIFRRFPYAILYTNRNGTILIAAVMHLHQDADSFLRERS